MFGGGDQAGGVGGVDLEDVAGVADRQLWLAGCGREGEGVASLGIYCNAATVAEKGLNRGKNLNVVG